jgi:hypothetical protein
MKMFSSDCGQPDQTDWYNDDQYWEVPASGESDDENEDEADDAKQGGAGGAENPNQMQMRVRNITAQTV